MTRRTLVETTRTGSTPKPGGSGRMLLQLITPGQGSSGFYPAATLQEAGRAKVFAKDCPQYLDHPTESERFDRPERSVRDLVGVLTEDARWTGSALVAEVQVFGPYRELLAEMAPHVGVSIRAQGQVEAREGVNTVTELVAAESVDYVTRAGRGGRVLQLLESARDAGRLRRPVSEADLDAQIARTFGRAPTPVPTLTVDEALDVINAATFGRETNPVRIAEANRVLDVFQASEAARSPRPPARPVVVATEAETRALDEAVRDAFTDRRAPRPLMCAVESASVIQAALTGRDADTYRLRPLTRERVREAFRSNQRTDIPKQWR